MIYHITSASIWEKALNEQYYRNPSLQTEGFIHCSSLDQLFGSAERHFKGQSDLLVLCIVEKRVKSSLKWEGSDPENKFPHIYGKFHISAVEDIKTLLLNANGDYELI